MDLSNLNLNLDFNNNSKIQISDLVYFISNWNEISFNLFSNYNNDIFNYSDVYNLFFNNLIFNIKNKITDICNVIINDLTPLNNIDRNIIIYSYLDNRDYINSNRLLLEGGEICIGLKNITNNDI